MEKRYKEIIMEDSRSENMLRRLLEVPASDRARRQRWMLMANGGWLRCQAAVGRLKVES